MTTSNIAGGFRTTGLYPLNRNIIQLPGECSFPDKLIAPNVGFTPFKRNPFDTYTSREIKVVKVPYVNPRPNCMKDRIKGPEVTNSTAFNIPLPNVFNINQGFNTASK